jgi:cardiolipin synthase A/B
VRIQSGQSAAFAPVVDGAWSTIGSSNVDWRSFCHNDEVNALFLGSDFGTHLRRVFEDDLALADEVTLAQWRQRGTAARLREWLARRFDYYL